MILFLFRPLGRIVQWNKSTMTLIQENALKNVAWAMWAILFRSQCVEFAIDFLKQWINAMKHSQMQASRHGSYTIKPLT